MTTATQAWVELAGACSPGVCVSAPRFGTELFVERQTLTTRGKKKHALERDRRFEFAWKPLRSYDEVWDDEDRQLHAAGQLFENVREEQEEVPETVVMLAQPGERDMDDHESNVSTDVAQDHMKDSG